eukprot:scaffold229162_cov35-Tisochrysis_lutea.AAC.1
MPPPALLSTTSVSGNSCWLTSARAERSCSAARSPITSVHRAPALAAVTPSAVWMMPSIPLAPRLQCTTGARAQ